MRLQKFLARAGAASRRGSEDLMTAGRVTVNGDIVRELGSKVDPVTDEVRLDGQIVTLADSHTYLMLHKPAGYLTTMDDPQGRSTVRELVPANQMPGLFPVGRLDNHTTGLLVFMTNGELAHQLLHPKQHVAKRYRATIDGVLGAADAECLREGIDLDDGPTAPALVELGPIMPKLLTPKERYSFERGGEPSVAQTTHPYNCDQQTLWITITEGRKRQVRRMLAHVGHPVLELEREAFGPLELGDLSSGEWRYLTDEEVEMLIQVVAAADPA
jgi:23S rRNA pseudouridine2605 synthase